MLEGVDSGYEGRAKALFDRDSFKKLRRSIASLCYLVLVVVLMMRQVENNNNRDWPPGQVDIVCQAFD